MYGEAPLTSLKAGYRIERPAAPGEEKAGCVIRIASIGDFCFSENVPKDMQPQSVRPAGRATAVLPRAAVLLAVLLFGCLSGCSKKSLMDRSIPAVSAEEIAVFRAELGEEFPAAELKDFDTALQELKLEAMNNGVSGVAQREERMRAAVNGKTVREALVLGWQARHVRVARELEDMSGRLEHDRQLKDRPGSADSSRFLSNLVANEQDIVAQLKRQLDDADEHLVRWGASAPAIVPAKAP
ncbi:hypothetical protein DB347_23505 [Opitutaceae bacterium EW11]|nr:hypothetical protein DB347_23505 [Opitutaceae bacterium EW11]